MNVGMKDVIQASVSLDRTTYSSLCYAESVRFTCNDVLTGSLVVTESLLHIKQVFLTLVKKEICYSCIENSKWILFSIANSSKTVSNMEDVCSMEVTDGSIALGTSFPFRFFLDDTQHVSPSYDSIGNRFTLEVCGFYAHKSSSGIWSLHSTPLMTISIISTFRLISVEEIFRKPTDHTFLSLCTVTLCHFISLIDVYDQSILY